MGLSSQLAASSLARPGVCTSSTRPASPYNGQLIYETDTRKVYIYNGTSWVEQPTAGMVDAKGDLLVGTAADTAARLAVGSNDTFLVASSGETTGLKWSSLADMSGGAWQSWTPTFGNFTLGNGSVTAVYCQIQKFIHCRVSIGCGTTTSVTGVAPALTMPKTAVVNLGNFPLGVIWWYDASAGAQFYGMVSGGSTTQVMFNALAVSTYVGMAYAQSGVPFTLGTGDALFMYFTYEAA